MRWRLPKQAGYKKLWIVYLANQYEKYVQSPDPGCIQKSHILSELIQ